MLRSELGGWPTARKLRIIAIKSFCSWLRAEGHLTGGNDPARDLKGPGAQAEKVIRPKGYPADLVERLYTVLWRQDVRDVVRLRAMVGMHHSEIERLPASEIRRVDDPTPSASARVRLSTPAHRSGDGDGHRAHGYNCERGWSFK